MLKEGHDIAESTHFMVVAVVRKLTSEGAVLVTQRMFSPRGVLSDWDFSAPPRERDWNGIQDAVCRECSLPGRYHNPRTMIATDTYPGDEFVSMAYPIKLNGPIADLFKAVDEATGGGKPSNVLANASNLLEAIETFDSPLVAVFDALTAKIRHLKIPPVIPLGSSELDVFEAQHPHSAAVVQAQAS